MQTPDPAVPSASHDARRVAVALVPAALLILLSAMVIVPPITMALFPLAVGSSEMSPFLVFMDLLWCIAASRLLRARRGFRYATISLLLLAAVVAVRPLTQFNRVARAASEQLDSPEGPARFSLITAVRGLPSSEDVVERTVRYMAVDGTPLTLRIYALKSRAIRPAIIVIYGGAWRGGNATQCANVSRALASRGYGVVAIDYRHAPQHRFPAQFDDVRASVAMVRDSAADWGLDASRMAILGRSSGGHLAKLEAYTPGGVPLRAVIAIYAPHDLVEGYFDLPSPDPIGVRAVLHDFIGGAPGERPAQYRTASPSSWVRRGLPPTLLLFGGHDHVVKPSFSREAAAQLRKANVRVVSVEMPWAEHGFDMVPSGLGAQLALGVIIDFLDRELARGR